ncbi:MAG: PAS domain S-box protein [Clostridia bacterium]|nr:PAS domain S-box protein [Clostridia bacterium]
MVSISMTTSLIGLLVSHIIGTLILYGIYRIYKKDFKGILHFLLSYLIGSIGLALVLARPVMPVFFGIIVTNTIILFSNIVLLRGIKIIYGFKPSRYLHIMCCILFAGLFTVFTYLYDNVSLRIIIYSMFASGIHMVAAFYSFRSRKNYKLKSDFILHANIFSGFFYIARIAVLVISSEVHNSFLDYRIDALMNLLYITFSSMLVIALISLICSKYNKALEESRNEYRELFNKAGVSLRYIGLDGRIIWFNEVAASILGMKVEELKGRALQDVYPADYAKALHEEILKTVESKNPFKSTEILKVDESNRYFDSTFSCIYNDGEELLGIQIVSNDITKMKKSEILLNKKEEEQSLLLKQVGTGIVVHANDSSILFSNQIAEEIIGLSSNEMSMKKASSEVWRFISESGSLLEVDEYPVSLVLRTKEPFRHYVIGKISTITEEIKWVDTNGFPIFNSDGNLDRVVISFTDITEEKRNSEALVESEAKHKSMISGISDVIAIVGKDGKIKYQSENSIKNFGWTADETIGNDFLSFIYPQDCDEISSIFNSHGNGEADTLDVECRLKCKNGEYKYIQMSARNMIEDPAINGILINYRDISEKKANERIYEQVIRTAMDGFCLIDPDGNIVDVNESNCRMSGYSRSELIGSKIFEFDYYQDQNDVSAHISEIIKSGFQRFVSKLIHKDGHVVDVDINVTYLPQSDRFFVFIHDITDEIRLEKQARNQQKLEAIGTLASGVAHEINNPINGVMNYGQLILDNNELDKETREYAGEIIAETERIASIVRNLLDFSRQGSEVMKAVDITEIVKKTITLISTVIKADQIEIECNIESGLPSVMGIEQEIRQVLMNLAINAKDALNEKYSGYHKDKKMVISARRHIENEQNLIRISVEDSGNGVPEEIQERIMEPFFTTKSRFNGTGLGLSISYGIIKKHKGNLTFDTGVGAGTRFYIDLPI